MIYSNFLKSIKTLQCYLKIMVGVILIVITEPTQAQGCCFLCWIANCCAPGSWQPISPNSEDAMQPSNYCHMCVTCCYCGVLPSFREDFTDEKLRAHAATCDGFAFTDYTNRAGIKVPTGRVPCESCGELERRVRAGPASTDLPVASQVMPPYRDPSLTRNIPDPKLLATMPTASSNQAFLDEYQKRRAVGNLPGSQDRDEIIEITRK